MRKYKKNYLKCRQCGVFLPKNITTSGINLINCPYDSCRETPKYTYQNKDFIINSICEYFDIAFSNVTCKSRKHHLIKARGFIIKFLRDKEKIKVTDIGKILSKNHGTIIHNYETIASRINLYDDYKQMFDDIESLINS